MPASAKPRNHPQPGAESRREDEETRVIPVVEEEISVSRVTEKTGRAVRVRIESREEREIVPVTESVEEVSVERVPINRYVAERSEAREEGDTVVIPVFETVPVVEMRLLLKEEIRIVRRRREVQREEEVLLRKDVPVIERRETAQGEWTPDPPES